VEIIYNIMEAKIKAGAEGGFCRREAIPGAIVLGIFLTGARPFLSMEQGPGVPA
jgi:hypothetical protein